MIVFLRIPNAWYTTKANCEHASAIKAAEKNQPRHVVIKRKEPRDPPPVGKYAVEIKTMKTAAIPAMLIAYDHRSGQDHGAALGITVSTAPRWSANSLSDLRRDYIELR